MSMVNRYCSNVGSFRYFRSGCFWLLGLIPAGKTVSTFFLRVSASTNTSRVLLLSPFKPICPRCFSSAISRVSRMSFVRRRAGVMFARLILSRPTEREEREIIFGQCRDTPNGVIRLTRSIHVGRRVSAMYTLRKCEYDNRRRRSDSFRKNCQARSRELHVHRRDFYADLSIAGSTGTRGRGNIDLRTRFLLSFARLCVVLLSSAHAIGDKSAGRNFLQR